MYIGRTDGGRVDVGSIEGRRELWRVNDFQTRTVVHLIVVLGTHLTVVFVTHFFLSTHSRGTHGTGTHGTGTDGGAGWNGGGGGYGGGGEKGGEARGGRTHDCGHGLQRT